MNSLLNISPVDGRYHEKIKELSDHFSEYALIKYRIIVEIKWLIFLIEKEIIDIKINNKEKDKIFSIIENFDINDAKRVKEIENETKHDVKACEYFLREKFNKDNLEKLLPFIHITLTSEDINNVSYNLMIKNGLEIYLSNLNNLINRLNEMAIKYKETPMLAHTHGQIASPTTVGKEIKVFSYRLESMVKLIKNMQLRSKFSGAVGNYNCHIVVFPNIEWINITKEFVESLKLEYNPLTTQIESHDILCVLLSYIKIINNIIKDLDSDMWLYISNSYFEEKSKINEVGSSVMPHKVNPINYENSMANSEISNGLIDALVNNLSISRMQRDLSDSSKLRNIGVIFSHSLISIKETLIGLNKIVVNEEYLLKELDNHYEVLSEVIQTVLRKNKITNGYEMLKEFTRGKKITKDELQKFIKELDINEEDKRTLLALEPKNYIGLCAFIVDNN